MRNVENSASGIQWPSPESTFPSECYKRFSSHARWQDCVNESFPTLEHRRTSKERFSAAVAAQQILDLRLSIIHASQSEVQRPARAGSSDDQYIKLMWLFSGTIGVEQKRRSTLLRPGQFTVCDTACSYKVQILGQSKFAVLMVPHHWVETWGDIAGYVCGSVLSNSMSLHALFGATSSLIGLDERGVSEADRTASETTLRQLLTLALVPRLPESDLRTGAKAAQFARAQQIIREKLDDPRFGPGELRESLHMSRRSLYLLFENHQTTPAQSIRKARIRRAAEIMPARALKGRKMIDVAFEVGFEDYATFCRIFKEEMGTSPRSFLKPDSKNNRCEPRAGLSGLLI
tara:strand:+ start:2215 stop:3252 length:1038 start_codon:yes stop_codon:yes gene_type:complete